MNIYHIWAKLKPGINDLDFVDSVDQYLDALSKLGNLETYRITRRKLGLGIEELLDFHIMVEFKDLEQFDQTFGEVAARKEPIESLHFAVNSKVSEIKFALYRDFPDDNRYKGDEKF